jgi:hypothetical protein
MDGVVIARGWSDLVDGTLAAPINVTQTGAAVTGTSIVWTGTNSLGQRATNVTFYHCGQWTDMGSQGWTGSTANASSQWSSSSQQACTTFAHLYCFEQ